MPSRDRSPLLLKAAELFPRLPGSGRNDGLFGIHQTANHTASHAAATTGDVVCSEAISVAKCEICSILNEDLYNVGRIVCHGRHKRRAAGVGHLVHVGLAFDKNFDSLCCALSHCISESCPAIVILRVDVSAFRNQGPEEVDVPCVRRRHQFGDASKTPCIWVLIQDFIRQQTCLSRTCCLRRYGAAHPDQGAHGQIDILLSEGICLRLAVHKVEDQVSYLSSYAIPRKEGVLHLGFA
mmetsp:Transcript_57533/g.134768  ORF Transcript_57533/g.134768 Transcript_57533/m.134768 type:complete len:238 (-) Transcript_57533:1617-2330(-)